MRTSLKTVFVLFLAFASIPAFANPAQMYTCLGIDKESFVPVDFSLLFGDHMRGAGYTNQAIIIEKVGEKTYAEPPVLQMYEATAENNCQTNHVGDIYMFGNFGMVPTKINNMAGYQVSFRSDCAEIRLDVFGYCFSEYARPVAPTPTP